MKLYQDALHKGVSTAWLYSRLGSLYLRQGNKTDAIALSGDGGATEPLRL